VTAALCRRQRAAGCHPRLAAAGRFFWFAGEASVAAQVRDAVFVDKGHPREAARISAYWKQGASAHHEDLS
jgi:NADPH-dependent ferric siderophore reductase